MRLLHQGRLRGRRARPPGVNTQEPCQVQTKLQKVQPSGAWQGLSECGAAKGRPHSPISELGAGIPPFGVSMGGLRGPYGPGQRLAGHRTSWASSMQAEGCGSQGSLAFCSPLPYPTLPQRLGTPWTTPTLINPDSSSQTLLLAGPGRGSPAWGEGRALDCSHAGGWAGKGKGVNAPLPGPPH